MEYCGMAHYYDRLMQDADYDGWCDFITEKCGLTPGASVLDAACGTGSITLRLAKKGFCLTGIDISQDMLFTAAEKARKAGLRAVFSHQDMTKMQLHHPVDAVCCVCDGVNYLTADRAGEFFKKAAAAVKTGGALLFDISTAYKLEKILGNEIFFEDYDDVTYFWRNSLHPRKKSITMELSFFVKSSGYSEGKRELYTRFDEKHEQYIHDFDSLKQLLCGAGFESIEIFDGYSERPVRGDSQRAVFVCRKKQMQI